MIIRGFAICLLLYLPTCCISQPVEVSTSEEVQSTLEKNEVDSSRIDLVSTEDLVQNENEDIDNLIEKVREVTNRYKKDVDGTIAEVQQILEDDYSLPRLTRGEIIEILDNLTKSDLEDLRKQGLKSRDGYQKALMLVMPYTSKDTKLSVEELYTKPPITHIVGSHIIKLTTSKKNIEVLNTTQNTEIPKLEESTTKKPFRTTKPTEITTKKHIFRPKLVITTHRPIYSKPTRFYNHKYNESTPFQSNKGITIINSPTLETRTTDKPRFHSQNSKKTTDNRLVVQSSVYRAPLTTRTRLANVNLHNLKDIQKPESQQGKIELAKHQSQQGNTQLAKLGSQQGKIELAKPESQQENILLAKPEQQHKNRINLPTLNFDGNLSEMPDGVQEFVKDIQQGKSGSQQGNVQLAKPVSYQENIQLAKPGSQYQNIHLAKPVLHQEHIQLAKPVSYQGKNQLAKHESQYGNIQLAKPVSHQEHIQLAKPVSQLEKYKYTSPIRTKIPTTNLDVNLPDIPDGMTEFMKDIQLAKPESLEKNKYSSQYVAGETQFQQPTQTEDVGAILSSIGSVPDKLPNLDNVADTLTPDMKELLMSFGLIENPNETKEIIPEEPVVKPVTYTQFKPLPESAPSRDDMYELLSSYGLVGSSRSGKKIEAYQAPKHLSEVPEIDMEMIPESMHGVLEDIGLTQNKRRGKRIEIRQTDSFGPVPTNPTPEELQKLNRLMETLVRLEKLNRTVTEDDFQDIDLENIAEITKIIGNTQNSQIVPLELEGGPSPLNDDSGLDKNEIKREEFSTSKADETTTTQKPNLEALEESFGGTTTIKIKESNPPIDALEQSFGGPATTKIEDATLPPPRKTGFYYLVDWNTFLEVGEEGKNRVNIKFSPRAGNPSRFLKVTIP